MDTFPYDSWAEAIEAADGTTGYLTFGPGGNTAIVIISILGILLATAWMAWLTNDEESHLNEAAERLNGKWGI